MTDELLRCEEMFGKNTVDDGIDKSMSDGYVEINVCLRHN